MRAYLRRDGCPQNGECVWSPSSMLSPHILSSLSPSKYACLLCLHCLGRCLRLFLVWMCTCAWIRLVCCMCVSICNVIALYSIVIVFIRSLGIASMLNFCCICMQCHIFAPDENKLFDGSLRKKEVSISMAYGAKYPFIEKQVRIQRVRIKQQPSFC